MKIAAEISGEEQSKNLSQRNHNQKKEISLRALRGELSLSLLIAICSFFALASPVSGSIDKEFAGGHLDEIKLGDPDSEKGRVMLYGNNLKTFILFQYDPITF